MRKMFIYMVYIKSPNTVILKIRYTYTSTEQSLWKIGLRKVKGNSSQGFCRMCIDVWRSTFIGRFLIIFEWAFSMFYDYYVCNIDTGVDYSCIINRTLKILIFFITLQNWQRFCQIIKTYHMIIVIYIFT